MLYDFLLSPTVGTAVLVVAGIALVVMAVLGLDLPTLDEEPPR